MSTSPRLLECFGTGLATTNDPRNVLQPPNRSPARAQPARVQFRRDPAQRTTPSAQLPNGREHCLFVRVRLQLTAVSSEPVSVSDVAYTLAVAALVVHCVACSLADRFPLPLRDCRHDVDH